MRAVEMLGLGFDNLDADGVMRELLARPPGGRFCYVVTPNADHLARLKRQPKLRAVYHAAWLCVLDSRLLAKVAALAGLRPPLVATGADIAAALLASLQWRKIAIIGLSEEGFAALRRRYPGLNFIHHAPPMNLLQNPKAFGEARDFAVQTSADFTFIALGSPLQEVLAYVIAQHPDARGIGLCVGAALEFCAGVAPRAPAWMQQAGLEWCHRLLQDPKRLAWRYLVDDPPVLFALMSEGFKRTAN